MWVFFLWAKQPGPGVAPFPWILFPKPLAKLVSDRRSLDTCRCWVNRRPVFSFWCDGSRKWPKLERYQLTEASLWLRISIPLWLHGYVVFFSSDCFWIVWKLEISTCLDSLKKATFVVWPIVPRMIFRETFCWSISWPFEPLQETRCSFRTFAFSEDGSTHNGRQQDESFMVIITCKWEVYPWFYRWFSHALHMVYSSLHNFHRCRC